MLRDRLHVRPARAQEKIDAEADQEHRHGKASEMDADDIAQLADQDQAADADQDQRQDAIPSLDARERRARLAHKGNSLASRTGIGWKGLAGLRVEARAGR